MSLDITRIGYTRVMQNGRQIARHSKDSEAYQTVSQLAPGTYIIERYSERVVVTGGSLPPFDPPWVAATVAQMNPATGAVKDEPYPESLLQQQAGPIPPGALWRSLSFNVEAEVGGTFKSTEQSGAFDYQLRLPDGTTQTGVIEYEF